MKPHWPRGFTLVELIVVIVILGIVAAVALPRFVDLGRDARLSVMHGVLGAMPAANAMIRTKAELAGVASLSAYQATVLINGRTIYLTRGYAADAAGLAAAMDLMPSSDFTAFGVSFRHNKAPDPSKCWVGYIPPSSDGSILPGYYINPGALDGC